jgi:hypothetical protein
MGPITPSASQLALDTAALDVLVAGRGVGVAPSMPSSVRIIAGGVEREMPDRTDDPE